MDTRFTRRTVAVALSASLVTALMPSTVAAASPQTTSTTPRILDLAPPAMLIAMQRDLGLSPTEAVERLVKEEAAARTEQRLHQELGADFAGAWLDDPRHAQRRHPRGREVDSGSRCPTIS